MSLIFLILPPWLRAVSCVANGSLQPHFLSFIPSTRLIIQCHPQWTRFCVGYFPHFALPSTSSSSLERHLFGLLIQRELERTHGLPPPSHVFCGNQRQEFRGGIMISCVDPSGQLLAVGP